MLQMPRAFPDQVARNPRSARKRVPDHGASGACRVDWQLHADIGDGYLDGITGPAAQA